MSDYIEKAIHHFRQQTGNPESYVSESAIKVIATLLQRIDELEVTFASAEGYISTLEDRVKELEAENSRYKEALTKLSKLGNEPHLGNSIGNTIAQEALSKEVKDNAN
jgi:uncharacterized coiled-coil protein SlyX